VAVLVQLHEANIATTKMDGSIMADKCTMVIRFFPLADDWQKVMFEK